MWVAIEIYHNCRNRVTLGVSLHSRNIHCLYTNDTVRTRMHTMLHQSLSLIPVLFTVLWLYNYYASPLHAYVILLRVRTKKHPPNMCRHDCH